MRAIVTDKMCSSGVRLISGTEPYQQLPGLSVLLIVPELKTDGDPSQIDGRSGCVDGASRRTPAMGVILPATPNVAAAASEHMPGPGARLRPSTVMIL